MLDYFIQSSKKIKIVKISFKYKFPIKSHVMENNEFFNFQKNPESQKVQKSPKIFKNARKLENSHTPRAFFHSKNLKKVEKKLTFLHALLTPFFA